MLVKNKKTGLIWDVSDKDILERVKSRTDEYEIVKPQKDDPKDTAKDEK